MLIINCKKMKNVKMFLCGFIALLYTPFIQAQTTPALTEKYSEAEVDTLIRSYVADVSRDATPPQILLRKFMNDFPKAYDSEWEKAKDVFEVEFEIGTVDYKAYYDAAGELLMYYYEAGTSKLPAAVRDAAKKLFPKYRFEEVKKVHKGASIFYKIEMERREHEVKIILNSSGDMVDRWIEKYPAS
jgi:hypothetical protein